MNSLCITMLKKGNYRMDIFAPERMTFFVIDSNEGYWTAFNTLGVSTFRAKTKGDIADSLRIATTDDLNLYNNMESI